MPIALALVVTLVLGGASVARALTVPPLDAQTDLEFSLDGSNWTDAPDAVLGEWGCDLAGGWSPGGAIAGTAGVDPCAMSPGEFIDRTYFVRNSTNTGRTGLYEVGIGAFELSELAEFDVSSEITAVAGGGAGPGSIDDPGSVTLYGPGTDQADQTPAPETRLSAVSLAPGASAKVVDTVSIPDAPDYYEQDQSVSPRIWVSFSDIGDVDTDRDGLPNNVEGEIGTDPDDPFNPLPSGTVGQRYGPRDFLPVTPEGATVVVDTSTLPPGMTLENGVLAGRPTTAGTYDIAFTITMPGGAEYTSIRRVVIHPSGGGGSSDLPGIFWPIIVGGIIGVIVGIIAPGLGSAAGSVGGAAGGSAGGILGSIGGIGSGSGTGSDSGSGSGTGSAAGSVEGSVGGSIAGSIGATVGNWISGLFGSLSSAVGSLGSVGSAGDATQPGGSAPGGAGNHDDSAVQGATGQIPAETVTSREASPSDEWARANSDVRSTLPTTGVGAADLLLWALTAAAAGATLILFTKRRRSRHSED